MISSINTQTASLQYNPISQKNFIRDFQSSQEDNQELSKIKYQDDSSIDKSDDTKSDDKKTKSFDNQLTQEDERVIDLLEARDAEVRTHEAAHMAAGGSLAGGASFSYQQGPNGQSYAIGGEVPITIQEGQTPQETINNMQQVKSAALAPADPSSADLKIAVNATMLEANARGELMQLKQDQSKIEQKDGLDKYQNEDVYTKSAS